MADNMTIGPALAIGGNKVEMTQQGKIQVTNPQGKIKTLSQDEFKKQLVKNADKIEAGQDFEFKKDNKNVKAAIGAGGLLTAAYVGLSLAVGKGKLTKAVAEQGKKLGFMSQVKNVFVAIGESGVKLWNSITGKAVKLKDKLTGKTEKAAEELQNKRYATYSKEQAANDAHRHHAATFDKSHLTSLQRDEMISDAQHAFADYDHIKFKKSKVLENAGLNNKQYDVVKEYANSAENVKLTKEQKEILPHWIQDKESCQRYVNSIEASFAKIDKQFAQ